MRRIPDLWVGGWYTHGTREQSRDPLRHDLMTWPSAAQLGMTFRAGVLGHRWAMEVLTALDIPRIGVWDRSQNLAVGP